MRYDRIYIGKGFDPVFGEMPLIFKVKKVFIKKCPCSPVKIKAFLCGNGKCPWFLRAKVHRAKNALKTSPE